MGHRRGQYEFVHAKLADGTYVPKMPPHRLGGGIYYRGRSTGQARVNLLHAFASGRVRHLRYATPGYNMLNAELSYTVKLSARQGLDPREVTTSASRGENLLNDDVRNSVSYKKDEVLLPGVNVRMFGIDKAQLTTPLAFLAGVYYRCRAVEAQLCI